jgi:trypsin
MNTKRCRDFALSTLIVAALLASLASAAAAAAPALQNLGPQGQREQSAQPVDPAGPVNQIVGGIPASISSYPWQARLEIIKPEGAFICAGTLIHPYIVLTAAHCLVDEEDELDPSTEVVAWFGRTLRSSGGIADEAYDLWVPTAFDHPSSRYDFAFISLFDEMNLPRLQLAGPTERALWTAGRPATIIGWGLTSEGGSLSPELREAAVPIVDDGTCALPQYNGPRFDPLTMLCAGYSTGGISTCQGDSGGPLMSPIDGGGFRLVGVTDWGYGCARPNKPSVFARVASDPIETLIAQAIPFIEREDAIPVTGINVIGAGARPPGCGVAETQLAAAATAAASSKGAAQAAKRKLHKAQRKSSAATATLRAALRSKRHRVPGSGHRLRVAKKKLKVAARKLKARRRGVGAVHRKVVANSAALTAATANRTAVCG